MAHSKITKNIRNSCGGAWNSERRIAQYYCKLTPLFFWLKWPIVQRHPVPTVSFPRQPFDFFSERRSKVFTLHTSHFTLHSFNSKLETSHSTLHTSHFALHSPHFTLLTSHCLLHTPNLTLHTSHFTLRSSHSKLKLHTPHFTLLTSHCFLHTAHFTLHSSRPTRHTALNLRATKKR